MNRIVKRGASFWLLVTVCGLMLLVLGSSKAMGVDFGLYSINFLGSVYDNVTNTTTFTYQVNAAVNYGIDDWTVELNPLCFGAGSIIAASEPYLYAGPDPATLIYGITFTTPYAPGETRIVWFKLPGNLTSGLVRVDVRYTCSHWTKYMEGPQCPTIGTPPPLPEGEGKSPGYWKKELETYLSGNYTKLKEPNLASYLTQYGYTAQQAYAIMIYGGDDMVIKLHRQVLAAKLSAAAGYLLNAGPLLAWGQYMVAHPGEFTFQELEDAKDLFESLHD
jgi:hypothetical protein